MRKNLLITMLTLWLLASCAAHHAFNGNSKELTSEQKTTLKYLEKMGATKAELDTLSVLIVTKAPQAEIQKRIDAIIQRRLATFKPEHQGFYYSLPNGDQLPFLASDDPGKWIERRDEKTAEQLRSTKEGKVQYFSLKALLTKEELKDFIRQDSLGRTEWLKKYWAFHDPTPTTPQNEFKEEFDRRVEFALTNFHTLGFMPWDDRAEVWIKLGEPLERVLDEESETWNYILKGKETFFYFEDKKYSGYYSLMPYQSGNKIQDMDANFNFLTQVSELGTSRVVIPHDYGAKPLDFAWEIIKFRYEKGSYDILVNIGIPADKIQRDSMGMINCQLRLAVRDDSGKIIAIDSTRISQRITEAENRLLVDQRKALLPPGSYQVALEFRDVVGGKIGLYKDDLFLPGYVDTTIQKSLEVSRAILSSKIVEADSGEKQNKFFVNGYLIVPNPGHVFFREQVPDIKAYFEIYNLTPEKDTAVFSTISWIILYKGTSDSALVSLDTMTTPLVGFVPGTPVYQILPLINHSRIKLDPGDYIWRIDVIDQNTEKRESIVNKIKIKS